MRQIRPGLDGIPYAPLPMEGWISPLGDLLSRLSYKRAEAARHSGATVLERVEGRASSEDQRGEEFSRIMPERLAGRDVVIVEHPDETLSTQAGWIAQAAQSLGIAETLEEGLGHVIQTANAVLIIDIDVFGEVDDAVDELLALRARAPHVAVLIASAAFKRNEIAPHRGAIADASVKLPTSRAILAEALNAALDHVDQRRGAEKYSDSVSGTESNAVSGSVSGTA